MSSRPTPQVETLLSGVTTAGSNSSRWVGVNNASRLSLMVSSSAVTSGNGVFTVYVSNDPNVAQVLYNRLTSNVANTNGQTDTRVASLTLSTNTSNFLFFPPGDTFAYVQVRVAVSTDGAYSAVMYID